MRNQSSGHVYHSVTLKNNVNGDVVSGLLIQTEEIDGKKFYVVQVGNKVSKFAYDGYKLIKR